MHDPQHGQSSSHAQGLEAKEIPSPSGRGRKMSLDFSSYRSGIFNISNDVGRVKGLGLLAFVVWGTRFT
jgi:hypothetical protein